MAARYHRRPPRGAITNPGQHRGGAPVLLLHAETDESVLSFVADDLLAAYCATGTVAAAQKYPDATHDSILSDSSVDALDWIKDRLDRDTASSDWRSISADQSECGRLARPHTCVSRLRLRPASVLRAVRDLLVNSFRRRYWSVAFTLSRVAWLAGHAPMRTHSCPQPDPQLGLVRTSWVTASAIITGSSSRARGQGPV